MPWKFICQYYSALIVASVLKIGNLFTSLPPLIPELLDDNTIYMYIDRIWIHLDINRLSGPVPIFVSLMISSTAVALIPRIKAIMIGIYILFTFQSIYALCIVYEQLYRWYDRSMQQGINMSEIIKYRPDGMGFTLTLLYTVLSNDLLIISCLWAVLIYFQNRQSNLKFPFNLL